MSQEEFLPLVKCAVCGREIIDIPPAICDRCWGYAKRAPGVWEMEFKVMLNTTPDEWKQYVAIGAMMGE